MNVKSTINSTETAEFIEKFGLFFEASFGYPKISGKIFAYLLISKKPYKSANQLIKTLKISKGSASNMLRLLLQPQIIEKISIPGRREYFYKIREGGWESLLIRKLETLPAIRVLLAEGKNLSKNKNSDISSCIEGMDKLYAFFEKEIPILIEKWKKFK